MKRPEGKALSRRSLLRTVGSAGALSLSGCFSRDHADTSTTGDSGGPTTGDSSDVQQPSIGSKSEIARRFDVPFSIETVETLEPTVSGGATITEKLLNVATGTLLYLPRGRYRINGHVLSENLANVAVVSDGAVIEPMQPAAKSSGYLWTLGGENFHLEGVTFDFTKERYGGRLQCIASGDFTLRNVTVKGVNEGEGTFRFDVRDPKATGLVENLTALDGGQTLGIFVGRQHAGELILRNCRIGGFYNNGLYGSAPGKPSGGGGAVKVEGGLFKNNNIAQVRIGTDGSYVKGTKIVVDGHVPPRESDGAINSRGIRLRRGTDHVVEDCDIHMSEGGGDGAIVFSGAAGGSTVRNTRINMATDTYTAAVNAKPTGEGGLKESTFENVDITGSADGVTGVLLIERDGWRFNNVTVRQRGRNSTGFHLIRSENVVIKSSLIRVMGAPIVLERSSIDADDLTKRQWPQNPVRGP